MLKQTDICATTHMLADKHTHNNTHIHQALPLE